MACRGGVQKKISLLERGWRGKVTDLVLTDAEISALTPGLTLPRCQVRHLRAAGFTRARLARGKVVLERAHYDAVCRGEFAATAEPRDTARPHLRPIKTAANS
jgi:hypothetical protein